MTIEQIRAAWLRWMHRRDLEADLDTVELVARAKIRMRLMREPPLPTTEEAPQLWLHAGLVYLQELAQDDDGLAREQGLFEQAATDEHFRWSQDNRPLPTIARDAR